MKKFGNLLLVVFGLAIISNLGHAADAKTSGFQLTDVKPGSVYDKIGLHAGDLVTDCNGHHLTSANDAQVLTETIKSKSHITIHVIRDGKPKTIEADLKKNAS